ncbi:unnamed protein product, partial [Rotaria socialis]
DGLVNNDNFFDNSAISWRILHIFELNRDIHYYRNVFQSLTCTASFSTAVDQGAFPPCLPLITTFNTDIDRARYFAILNYLKDYNVYVSSIKFDEHQMTQHLTTDTSMQIGTGDCWKV